MESNENNATIRAETNTRSRTPSPWSVPLQTSKTAMPEKALAAIRKIAKRND